MPTRPNRPEPNNQTAAGTGIGGAHKLPDGSKSQNGLIVAPASAPVKDNFVISKFALLLMNEPDDIGLPPIVPPVLALISKGLATESTRMGSTPDGLMP